MKHLKLTPTAGEVKVDDPSPVDDTAITIKDKSPTKMHRNPHWNKLKKSVKASNAFKSSSGQNQKRVKRLSTVMKSRRNSALQKEK